MQIKYLNKHSACLNQYKYKVITSYLDKCIDPDNCVSCERKTLGVHDLVGVNDVDNVNDIDMVSKVKLLYSYFNYIVAEFMLMALWIRFLIICKRKGL